MNGHKHLGLILYLSNITIVTIIVIVVFVGGFKIWNKMIDIDHINKLALTNYTENNKKNILLKLIDTNTKIPVEQKVKLRDTIYDLCYIKNIPLSLICGLIEVESEWNPSALSEANAKGLFQILPSTAKPYLRYEKIDYAEDTLFDPVVSAIVGISYLYDLQSGHVESGKTKKDDYTLCLHSYFWGVHATYELYGKKDMRVNVPNMSYPMRVLETTKKYQTMGL